MNLKMILGMMGLDASKLPSEEQLATGFTAISAVPESLDKILTNQGLILKNQAHILSVLDRLAPAEKETLEGQEILALEHNEEHSNV